MKCSKCSSELKENKFFCQSYGKLVDKNVFADKNVVKLYED